MYGDSISDVTPPFFVKNWLCIFPVPSIKNVFVPHILPSPPKKNNGRALMSRAVACTRTTVLCFQERNPLHV